MAFKLDKNKKIYVAGHTGLIGSAFNRYFDSHKYNNVIYKKRSELDLTSQKDTDNFFQEHKPKVVILAAGKVGGIIQNRDFPLDFISQNLSIQLNVFNSAREFGVEKLLFFGSSCMYPKNSLSSMSESQIFSGDLEPTSISYATAKYAGIQMCQAVNRQFNKASFISVIPNSVYGPNDNFDLNSSHVLSALIRRIHEAKVNNLTSVSLWGTGSPRREFIYSDDLVEACILLIESSFQFENFPINISEGVDFSIKELSIIISKIIGYKGQISWDSSKPDGAMKKLLDNSKIKSIGWNASTDLEQGIIKLYKWYINNIT
jgi:GDP-L-fucose synthase